jgi:hypothetical protein
VEPLAYRPSFQSADICGTLSDAVLVLYGGDTLYLDLMLRDNEALSQYKIEIHQNFDCHGHAGKVEDWQWTEVVDVSGQEARISRAIPVPVDVSAGAYNYHYQAIDQAGNSSPYALYYDLLLRNRRDSLPPTLRIDQPEASRFEQARGTMLRVQGALLDDQPLNPDDKARLRLEYVEPSTGNRFTAEEWPLTDQEFDLDFALPSTWPTGNYEFLLKGYDAVNNASLTHRFTVELLR